MMNTKIKLRCKSGSFYLIEICHLFWQTQPVSYVRGSYNLFAITADLLKFEAELITHWIWRWSLHYLLWCSR